MLSHQLRGIHIYSQIYIYIWGTTTKLIKKDGGSNKHDAKFVLNLTQKRFMTN